jgi:hypothetical protein
MKWVREHSKPYRLELKYNSSEDRWSEVQDTLHEAKKWCRQNNMFIWDDGLFYIRFINHRDLAWFLLRWA